MLRVDVGQVVWTMCTQTFSPGPRPTLSRLPFSNVRQGRGPVRIDLFWAQFELPLETKQNEEARPSAKADANSFSHPYSEFPPHSTLKIRFRPARRALFSPETPSSKLEISGSETVAMRFKNLSQR